MEGFNPYTQTVSFLSKDGVTPIQVPIPKLDEFSFYSVSVSLSYGTQLGAVLIMLFVTLLMTPTSKLRRPSGILHILVLVLCVIRMALLAAYFPSDFNEFYNVWAGDYSAVATHHFYVSIAANTISLLLVVAIELALMNQAWTMVTLWPSAAKYTLSVLSVCITLLTIGWKLAVTTLQNKSTLELVTTQDVLWVSHGAIITNAISICWFCALFNIKLVLHLITNRSVLPAGRSLAPMEVLVMTNGLLMFIPGLPPSILSSKLLLTKTVTFSSLEFAQFANFESASMTLTSVALILPMGTLAAQRVSQSYGLISDSSHTGLLPQMSTCSSPLKGMPSFNTNTSTVISSRCEGGRSMSRDPIDVELGQIDGDYPSCGGKVRVERGFEQREERV